MKGSTSLLVLLAVSATPAFAGSYVHVAECTSTQGCLMGKPVSQNPGCAPNCSVTAFGISHPIGYQGSQTSFHVRICLDAADIALEPALLRAIEYWNTLTPTARNCHGCCTWEEPPSSGDRHYAVTVMAHELGHCAMGLTHVDRLWDVAGDGNFENTSFTRSANAANQVGALDAGADLVRGSRDDFHQGLSGNPAVSVSWFRLDDNDPFKIDATVIDTNEFSRNRNGLPAGHSWPASANHVVGNPPGAGPGGVYFRSQAVMYSLGCRRQYYFGLGADDVNMVKMARTGPDLLAGTIDDYTTTLDYVGACTNPHEVQVMFDVGNTLGGNLAECQNTRVDYTFPGDVNNVATARHFTVVHDPAVAEPIQIRFNTPANVPWDYNVLLFIGDVEAGDLGDWSGVFP